ncbi:MAG: hypothetical protein WCP21_22965 [Armatimonadota bacterium]
MPSGGRFWQFDGRPLREGVFPVALLAATVVAVTAMAYAGMLREALVMIVTLLAIPVVVRRPLILVFAYLVVSTNLFETLPLREMTALQAGPVALTVPGALIIMMLVVAVVRLRKRRQRPMFLGFVILWCAYVGFQIAYGYVLGETATTETLLMPFVRAQDLVGWVLYLLLVAFIDSPRDLRVVGWFYFGIMVFAVLYQVAEYAHGGSFPLFQVPGLTTYANQQAYISVGGAQTPYLWSRATGANQVAFFLAFAAAVGGRRFLVYGSLAAAGLLGIALTQIRGIYFGVAVGIVAVLVLYGAKARRLVRVLALVGLVALIVTVATPVVASSFGGDPLGSIVKRASTLANYGSDANWIKRVHDAERAWNGLMQISPYRLWLG